MYISSEFQVGQVYMGDESTEDDIILYRPVYACIPHERKVVTNVVKDTKENSFAQNRKENSVSDSRELMLKPIRTNAVNETDVVNNDDHNKAKVVFVVEPSESDNVMSTCVKGDSSVAGDTDEVKDNNVADMKEAQEISTDVA